ncbi:MAG: PRD domain-containing protein, partial [Bacillota bacterium]
GTFVNDLEAIRSYCSQFEIAVQRKQGLGVYMEGNEENLRQAIANVIYDAFDEQEIYNLLKSGGDNPQSISEDTLQKRELSEFIDEKTMGIVEKILSDMELKHNKKFIDFRYMGLVMHISLAIKRIQNKEKIEMAKDRLEQLRNSEFYEVATEIAKALEETFACTIPNDEIGFIALHLMGTSEVAKHNSQIQPSNENGLSKLIWDMTVEIEKELHIKFRDKGILVEELLVHAIPMVRRLQLRINIKNTHLSYMKEEYGEIFTAVANASKNLIGQLGVESISEEEIGFLTMYFCAVMDNRGYVIQPKIRVVVSCPSGMGTSLMLSMKLKKNFSEIQVVDVLAIDEVTPTYLEEKNIDFIFSTVKQETQFPTIVVSPILKEPQKQYIRKKLDLFKKTRKSFFEEDDNEKEKQTVVRLTRLGDEILKVIGGMQLKELTNEDATLETLTEKIYTTLSQDIAKEEIKNRIKEGLCVIERGGGNRKIIWLRVEKREIKKGNFGYFSFKEGMDGLQEEVVGIFVILAPDEESDPVFYELMNQISQFFLQDDGLRRHLLDFNESRIQKKIESILLDYYKMISQRRWEW